MCIFYDVWGSVGTHQCGGGVPGREMGQGAGLGKAAEDDVKSVFETFVVPTYARSSFLHCSIGTPYIHCDKCAVVLGPTREFYLKCWLMNRK